MLLTAQPPAPSPWVWHPHFEVWGLMLGLAVAYWAALRYWRPAHLEMAERPATRGQVTFFLLGLAAMWAAGDWPVHELSERHLYGVHMAQHLLLTLAAPPLLLAGIPDWLARRILKPPGLMKLARKLTRPLPALLIFNGVLVLSHWPLVVDATLRNEWLHFGSHTILLLSGLIMWSPVFSPLPELPRISYPAQLLYLFLQTIVPTVPASFLTFASRPIYRFYETLPHYFSISVLDDQRIAGLVMKLGGGLALWSVIAGLFFRWSSREARPEKPDVLEWHEVERELNRIGRGRR
ncbi:MAG: cytochrome c oxidase assembly protein [Candidatus Methylomirabilales bacterium]